MLSSVRHQINERFNTMSKSKKLTPLPTDKVSNTSKPKLHKRALDLVNYTVLPFLAKAIILAGFGWAVVDNLARFNALPETAQGATAVIVIALILKVATNKPGKK